MQTEQVIGGAGTGKTRLVLDKMSEFREREGLESWQIGFSTFTRRGTEEMAERAEAQWGVSRVQLMREEHFRTVHSTALRGLGVRASQVLSDDTESLEWMRRRARIDLELTLGEDGALECVPLQKAKGEEAEALKLWFLARNLCIPIRELLERHREAGDAVPSWDVIHHVVSQYESAKVHEKKLDYCDILSRYCGLKFNVEGVLERPPEGNLPPGVVAYFFDECQDSSALVHRVCLRLAAGPDVRYVLMAGDPFQSVYGSFAGGDYRLFLDWPAAKRLIMPRSHRCPHAILSLGEALLREMKEGYRDRGIQPAEHDGQVVRALSAHGAIGDHVDPRESTLIVTRCKHTLGRYARELGQSGIPYQMLGAAPEKSLEGMKGLRTLASGDYIHSDDWFFIRPLLRDKDDAGESLIDRRQLERWESTPHDEILHRSYVDLAGASPSLKAALHRGEWRELLLPILQDKADRWLTACDRFGEEAATVPKVRLSTIHGAKGAEACTVLMSTETSRTVERSRMNSKERHDEECRVAYVGVTRASKKLVIVEEDCCHRMLLPL